MRKTVGGAALVIAVALLLASCAAAGQSNLQSTASPVGTACITSTTTPTGASPTSTACPTGTPSPTHTTAAKVRHRARHRRRRPVLASRPSQPAPSPTTAAPVPTTTSPAPPTTASAHGAWCTANVHTYPDSDNDEWYNDVYVSSNQPDTEVIASGGGYSHSWWTDGSGSAVVYLDGPPPGTAITVTVGGATC
jgi:hypothetical protein